MTRLVRAARVVLAAAIWAWAAWQWLALVREWLAAPRYAADADTGQVYGFRVSPLTAAERAAAAARERILADAWGRTP